MANSITPRPPQDDVGDLQRAMLAVFSGSITRTVARIILIVFVVRLYGLGSFGYLGEVAALVELLAALASFGLPKTLMAYLDKTDGNPIAEGQLISNAITLSAILGAGLGLILWLAWSFIFPVASEVPSYAASAVVLIAVTELLLTVTRSRRIIRWDALVKGFVKPWSFLLFLVGGYYLLVQTESLAPVTALFAGYMGAAVLAFLVAIIGLVRTRRQHSYALVFPTFAGVFSLLRHSFSTAIVDAGSFSFRRLDIILLGVIAGPTATGIYYLVQQLATVVEKMRHLFEPMAAPVLAQARSMTAINSHLKKLCLWIFSAQIGLAMIFIIFANQILGLFDALYAQAALLMAVFLLGEIAEGTSGLIELPLIYNKPAIASRNIVVAFLCEMGLVSIGSYHLGILGAAGGFAGAMLLLAMLRFTSARRALGLTIINLSYAKPLIAAMFTSISMMGLNMIVAADTGSNLALSVAIAIVLYLGILRLLGVSFRIVGTA
jgi:O-antigen/teichoic acid export membrane protein